MLFPLKMNLLRGATLLDFPLDLHPANWIAEGTIFRGIRCQFMDYHAHSHDSLRGKHNRRTSHSYSIAFTEQLRAFRDNFAQVPTAPIILCQQVEGPRHSHEPILKIISKFFPGFRLAMGLTWNRRNRGSSVFGGVI